MSKIKLIERKGKHLFEYMTRGLTDLKLANLWAMENFVLVDDKHLDTVEIARMNDRAYLMISAKIFPMIDESVTEDNIGVHFKGVTVKNRRIHRDFITQLQTEASKNINKSKVEVIKSSLLIFFDTTVKELDEMPFQLVAFLINKSNFFLTEFTTPRDEFDINDVWDTDPRVTTDDKLVGMVSENEQISEENK